MCYGCSSSAPCTCACEHCGVAKYCNKICGRAHWYKTHQFECVGLETPKTRRSQPRQQRTYEKDMLDRYFDQLRNMRKPTERELEGMKRIIKKDPNPAIAEALLNQHRNMVHYEITINFIREYMESRGIEDKETIESVQYSFHMINEELFKQVQSADTQDYEPMFVTHWIETAIERFLKAFDTPKPREPSFRESFFHFGVLMCLTAADVTPFQLGRDDHYTSVFGYDVDPRFEGEEHNLDPPVSWWKNRYDYFYWRAGLLKSRPEFDKVKDVDNNGLFRLVDPRGDTLALDVRVRFQIAFILFDSIIQRLEEQTVQTINGEGEYGSYASFFIKTLIDVLGTRKNQGISYVLGFLFGVYGFSAIGSVMQFAFSYDIRNIEALKERLKQVNDARLQAILAKPDAEKQIKLLLEYVAHMKKIIGEQQNMILQPVRIYSDILKELPDDIDGLLQCPAAMSNPFLVRSESSISPDNLLLNVKKMQNWLFLQKSEIELFDVLPYKTYEAAKAAKDVASMRLISFLDSADVILDQQASLKQTIESIKGLMVDYGRVMESRGLQELPSRSGVRGIKLLQEILNATDNVNIDSKTLLDYNVAVSNLLRETGLVLEQSEGTIKIALHASRQKTFDQLLADVTNRDPSTLRAVGSFMPTFLAGIGFGQQYLAIPHIAQEEGKAFLERAMREGASLFEWSYRSPTFLTNGAAFIYANQFLTHGLILLVATVQVTGTEYANARLKTYDMEILTLMKKDQWSDEDQKRYQNLHTFSNVSAAFARWFAQYPMSGLRTTLIMTQYSAFTIMSLDHFWYTWRNYTFRTLYKNLGMILLSGGFFKHFDISLLNQFTFDAIVRTTKGLAATSMSLSGFGMGMYALYKGFKHRTDLYCSVIMMVNSTFKSSLGRNMIRANEIANMTKIMKESEEQEQVNRKRMKLGLPPIGRPTTTEKILKLGALWDDLEIGGYRPLLWLRTLGSFLFLLIFVMIITKPVWGRVAGIGKQISDKPAWTLYKTREKK